MFTFKNANLIATLTDTRPAGLPPLFTVGGDGKDGIKLLGQRNTPYGLFYCLPTDKDAEGKPAPSSMLTVMGVKHLAYARGLVQNKGRLSIEEGMVAGRPCVAIPVSISNIQVALEPTVAQLKMGAVAVAGISPTAKILWRTNGFAIGSELPPNKETGKVFNHTFVVRVIVPAEAAREWDLQSGRQLEVWNMHDSEEVGYVFGTHFKVTNIDAILYKNRKEVNTPEKGEVIGTQEVGEKEITPFAVVTL